MNRILRAILTALPFSLFFVPTLHAADGLYLGAAIGQAGIKDNINTETFDSNDAAYKAFIGWRFKVPVVNLAVEGAYTDFGKPSQTLGGQSVETKLHGPSGRIASPATLGPCSLVSTLCAPTFCDGLPKSV